jgi:alpha-galactosidase
MAGMGRSCVLIVAWLAGVASLENGLGKLPGMGWNSDYCTNCSSSDANGFNGPKTEKFIQHIAEYLNTSGLQKLGYQYVNMDATWDEPTRDANGDLVPKKDTWPSGMEKTISYIHNLGLSFGLYGDKGATDCAKNPGQLAHEVQDAKFFAKYKVDWYKEDSCYSGGTEDEQIAAYAKMRDALNATGRKIWFALCGWKTFYATAHGAGQELGNSWRIGPDTGTGWSSVMINTMNGILVSKARVPGPSSNGGAWSDGSLLLNPGMGHGDENRMSNDRHRSMFSLWCTMGFNLLLTGCALHFPSIRPQFALNPIRSSSILPSQATSPPSIPS